MEEYKGSEEFRDLMLEGMVEEQLGWEKLIARFNPALNINFDIGGVPPPIPSSREWMFTSPSFVDSVTSPDAEGSSSRAIPMAKPVAKEA